MTSVSHKRLSSALEDVQNELERIGLWEVDSRLPEVDVFWCAFPQTTQWDALGFFVHESSRFFRLLGYDAGNMYIPRWVMSQGFWQKRGSLRDVLRHEYGHAVAHYYPAMVQRSARFRSVFGGRYSGEFDKFVGDADYVSHYAQTNPAEDFAETFMIYVRRGGKPPKELRSKVLKRKWRFIKDLCRAISRGATRWAPAFPDRKNCSSMKGKCKAGAFTGL